MKTKWVATPIAGKVIVVPKYLISCGFILFINVMCLVISCAKSEDSDPFDNETFNNQKSIIIYTDIVPDFTCYNRNAFYELDLNNDHSVDFILHIILGFSCHFTQSDLDELKIYTSKSGNGFISISSFITGPLPVDAEREIFNLSGHTNGDQYESEGIFIIGGCENENGGYYDWKDITDKYLGLRFLIDGKTHYGWARMDVESATQWVIKDYAYNATPNKPILAGQKI